MLSCLHPAQGRGVAVPSRTVAREGRELAAANGTDRVSRGAEQAHRTAFWLRRYAPAEVAATLGAIVAAFVDHERLAARHSVSA